MASEAGTREIGKAGSRSMNMKRQFVVSDALIEFSMQALIACGVEDEAAQVTARHLIGADMRGVDTHGIVRLPLYILSLIHI